MFLSPSSKYKYKLSYIQQSHFLAQTSSINIHLKISTFWVLIVTTHQIYFSGVKIYYKAFFNYFLQYKFCLKMPCITQSSCMHNSAFFFLKKSTANRAKNGEEIPKINLYTIHYQTFILTSCVIFFYEYPMIFLRGNVLTFFLSGS